jgi:hypothetical protein
MDEESDGMDGMREDPIEKRKSYERYFREHLYIDDLKQSYPYDHGRIDEILDLLVDTVCSTAKTIRCAGEDRPAEVVKSRFMKLDYGHIQYVWTAFMTTQRRYGTSRHAVRVERSSI